MIRPALISTSVIAVFVIALVLAGVPVQEVFGGQQPEKRPDVIFVPTPEPVVEKMLELAEVDANDVVYDLGSGDGRLVITAAKKHGARGVGIDIDPQRIRESNENAVKAGVADKVKFLQQDLFETDISEATAVTLYLLTELNIKLRPKLMAELRPGTPVVSHDFSMGDWKPEQTINVQGPTRSHTVYRWTIPAKASGNWRLNGGPAQALYLEQEFQEITGTVTVNGRELPVSGRVDGEKLSFRVPASAGAPMQFNGRIVGERLEGTLKANGETAAWSGERENALAAGK